MSDRRAQQYPPSAHVALVSQWSGSGQYQTSYASQDQYSSPYQSHPSLRGASHSPHSVGGYDSMSAQAQAIATQYQLSDQQMHYPHIPTSDRRSSLSMSQYGAHSVDSHYGSPGSQVASRAHSHSHSHSYPHSSSHGSIPHSPSHAYSQTQAMAANAYAAPLSSSPQSPSAMSNMTTAQYASQAAYPQQVSSYPASPPRPFACDMCALSFNRQHDLKRHRDTHTGEKPFFCNGGCGKTFTRKDALKRHQLVKRCGIDDSS